ncbi:MAG: hypothetical protein ACJ79H_00070 [Myxococcales bacterium]
MRPCVLVALLLAPSFVRAADPPRHFEVGAAAGAGGAILDSSTVAGVFSAYAGYDFGNGGPRVRALGVLGPTGLDFAGGGSRADPSANSAWSLLAELQLHSPGTTQFVLAFGAGIGRLIRAQTSTAEQFSLRGAVAPAFELSAGVRTFAFHPGVAVGAELSALWWNGIEQNVAPRGSSVPTASESRSAVTGLALSLTIGFPL